MLKDVDGAVDPLLPGRQRRQSGDGAARVETILSGLDDARGLAVDWLGLNVFFVDASQKLLGAITLDGRLRRDLIATELDQPQDIVVDPLSGSMFWSDLGLSARIETARMDGASRRVLVDNDVLYPTGLAVDYPARRLYWADAKTGTIESVSLEGKERVVIRRFRQQEDKPFKVAARFFFSFHSLFHDSGSSRSLVATKHSSWKLKFGSEVVSENHLKGSMFGGFCRERKLWLE